MSATIPFSVCVYCGSRPGNDPAYADAARAIGQEIGKRGWRLVYGGGNVGLMGEVADTTLAAGGQVIGVIPERLLARELAHHRLSELHIVRTMHERKRLMAEQSHAFVALAGGLGTLEELFEVWTWRHLGYHHHPIGMLDTAGYYQPLLNALKSMTAAGFIEESQLETAHISAQPAELLDTIARSAAIASGAITQLNQL